MPSGADRHLLDAVDRSGVLSLYQPVARLDDREIIAYEALARARELPQESAATLLAQARRAGRLADIEWQCRLAALQGGLDAALGTGLALFVNIEPATMGEPAPPGARPLLRRAAQELSVVAELTERDLLRRPADLLQAVAQLRRADVQIALDDVGANPDSLALLEFVHPDVVKLDLALIQQVPAASRTRTLMAVMAYCERSHAQLLAEGIENDDHLEQALALGATLGQGFLFGRAAALPPGERRHHWRRARTALHVPQTPFDLAAAVAGERRVAPKRLLVALSRDIERQAANDNDPPVILATFQHAERFGAAIADHYAALARTSPLVAVFGAAMPPEPAPGVRGVDVDPDDPLLHEWTLVVLGAHYCAALIACDLGDDARDDGSQDDRRFAFLITHDRDTVTAAGRSMLTRMTDRAPSTARTWLAPLTISADRLRETGRTP